MIVIIKITKEESKIVREKIPQAHMSMVNRKKKYKKYFVEPLAEVVRLLEKIRNGEYYKEQKGENKNGGKC